MATPRVAVEDTTSAQPARFGILNSAASVIEDNDERWSAGFDYETLDCGTTVRLSTVCSSSTGTTIVQGDPNERFRGYYPFSIETEFTCSTFGFPDYEKLALDRLLACQQKAIERELWTGTLAKVEDATPEYASKDFPNRYLASTFASDVTPTPGTAVKPKYGLALLEQALASCGCGVQGTMHATRGVASTLGLSASGDVLTTPLGTPVVAGSGYTGTGPDGTAPTGARAWMYATGPLTVRLGPVHTVPGNRNQSTNIANNSVLVFADRAAAVTWDTCCHFGVLVDLSLDYS